ncbi:MAG: hypothetical protein J6A72_01025 [Alistipes sp.]|nr:hypothetical protein [Alistipes sp.]
MDKIKLLAEKILINAAKSNDGNCYPSQINVRSGELYNALELLEMYGSTFPMSRGALPIFTINELGKHFASTGAWSGEEARAGIATARHNEQMAAQRKNNNLVRWSIVATVVIGLATLLVAIFK